MCWSVTFIIIFTSPATLASPWSWVIISDQNYYNTGDFGIISLIALHKLIFNFVHLIGNMIFNTYLITLETCRENFPLHVIYFASNGNRSLRMN